LEVIVQETMHYYYQLLRTTFFPSLFLIQLL